MSDKKNTKEEEGTAYCWIITHSTEERSSPSTSRRKPEITPKNTKFRSVIDFSCTIRNVCFDSNHYWYFKKTHEIL